MPTILVVEDDPHVRRLTVRALRMAGYQVCEAVDGLDAQLQFAQCAPDLVLTDLHMPGLDGAELAQWVHAQKAIPIVLMTAAAAPCGSADTVLGKPFTIQALTETVKTALRGPSGSAGVRQGGMLAWDAPASESTTLSTHEVASYLPPRQQTHRVQIAAANTCPPAVATAAVLRRRTAHLPTPRRKPGSTWVTARSISAELPT